MMTTTRRNCTLQFKLEAVHLLEASGKSATQLERELGISGGCLYRWKREFHIYPHPSTAFRSTRSHPLPNL
jgi:transposase-like protein